MEQNSYDSLDCVALPTAFLHKYISVALRGTNSDFSFAILITKILVRIIVLVNVEMQTSQNIANVPLFHLKVIICCAVISTTAFLWFVMNFARKSLFPGVLSWLHYVHFFSCSKLKSPLKSSPIGSCTERNRDKHDYNLQHGNMMVRELSSFGNSFFFSFLIYLFIC